MPLALSSEVSPLNNITRVEGTIMSVGTILIILLILMLVGVLPTWPHSREWGYAPSGLFGTVLLILIVLFLLGRL